MSMKNSKDTIGIRTRYFPAGSTAPLCASGISTSINKLRLREMVILMPGRFIQGKTLSALIEQEADRDPQPVRRLAAATYHIYIYILSLFKHKRECFYWPVATLYSYNSVATVCSYSPVTTVCSYSLVATVCSYSPITTVCSYSPVSTVCSYSPVATLCSYSPVSTVCSYSPIATYVPMQPSQFQFTKRNSLPLSPQILLTNCALWH
jgi:hypothetical protein